jgi:putative nucleotidyltransferase with HDIG domain
MNALIRGSGIARVVLLALAIVFSTVALMGGRASDAPQVSLQEGQPAPETFIAPRPVTVIDATETAAERARASAAVEDIYRPDPQATETVLDVINAFFEDVRTAAVPIPQVVSEVTPPTTFATTTTAEDTTTTAEETTTTTSAAETTGSSDDAESTTSLETTTSTSTTTTTLPPKPAPLTTQMQQLESAHPFLSLETIAAFVDLINDDLERSRLGEPQLFAIVEIEAIDQAEEFLLDGIRSTELDGVRTGLVANPRPIVLLRGIADEDRAEVEAAVAELVALSLQTNEFQDDASTQIARFEAESAVEDVVKAYSTGEAIVRANEIMTAVQIQAISDLGLIGEAAETTPLRALALIAATVVLLASAYLWRVGSEFWRQPKLVGLFALLIVLSAAAARIPELVARDQVELGFLLPAALLGYLTANLFDARIAVVIALPMAVFTALATGDLALTTFAAAATLTPIPLVSSVASRSQLNLAVVISAVIHIPIAVGVSWFFYGSSTIVLAAVWGFVSGIATGVVALGVLPILSSAFRITTTQTLLDLTDRNHPALRRIEEMAPGTFNHSIMVGNLADGAARSVGANPLLARSMAYYHDLGKTVEPKYFVENQFGVTNPHDRLPPQESATIIRSHVAEGLRLAREYRIPPDVAQGILTHHGTSLMRFFYHKAESLNGGEVESSDFRHRGRKPKSKEMVIVMLADATEAATRALVQHEDPTSEGIRELVESVIAEKVEDGQLEESEVTFGELTRLKEAFVDSLIGYYHTRIPYPNFPSGGGDQPA